MSEGSLGAPTRHIIDWTNPDFYNEKKLDDELRRVFDICHGCRRCFNLCDSFPTLFDLIDESPTEELDAVASEDFKPVADGCTLCDMCFMTKCPYVPPHEFNLDFPHLMLRYRAVEKHKGQDKFVPTQLSKMDRNGKLAAPVAPLANWATKTSNTLTRGIMEKHWASIATRRCPNISPNHCSSERWKIRWSSIPRRPAMAGKRLSTPPVLEIIIIQVLAKRPARSWPAMAWKRKLSIPVAAACR